MTALLEAREISVRYGRVGAVANVSLEVREGEALAVLGRNGAGKSSLLMALAGGQRPDTGRIFWKGRDITRWPAEARVSFGLALVPEGRRTFPLLTVHENLRLGGFGLSNAAFNQAVVKVYDLFPVLNEHRDAPAGSLSGGQQQMLALARPLVGQPQLLLLDELSLGLAPLVVDEVYAGLDVLRAQGLAMVLVEQHVQRALNFADSVLVLHLGEPVISGTTQEVRQDERLISAYLGGNPVIGRDRIP